MDEKETYDVEPNALQRSMAISFQLLFGALLLVMLAVSLHAAAMANEAASRRLPGFGSRLAAAERAALIEPWNMSLRVRLATLKAERLVREGKADEAYDLLEPLTPSARGDADFAAVYESVLLKRTLK